MSDQWGDDPVDGPSEPPYVPPSEQDSGRPPGHQPPGHQGSTPTVGVPPTSYPPGGDPQQQPQDPYQQGYPPQGYPPQDPYQQGYPPQSYPPQGYPPQGYPPQGGAPYSQPPYAYGAAGYVPAQASSDANTAMGLSIAGLALMMVLGVCCGPFSIAGIALCGIGAYMGTKELRAIDAGLSSPAGRSQAKAAQIIGGIGIALAVAAIAFIIFFIGVGTIGGA